MVDLVTASSLRALSQCCLADRDDVLQVQDLRITKIASLIQVTEKGIVHSSDLEAQSHFGHPPHSQPVTAVGSQL